jgi:phytoene dehydrogenase-like protein
LALWRELDQTQYARLKDEFVAAMTTEIEKVLPSFRIHTRVLHSGSPLTYGKYIGKVEVGGTPLTVRNALLSPNSLYSGHAGLYFAGEKVFPGPGTLSAGLSGFYAARAVAGELGLSGLRTLDV